MVSFCIKNYEEKILSREILKYNFEQKKTLDGGWVEGWVEGWMDGWMDGWMEAKAGLRIAYSNQKYK